jgi:drug/metabolite transporter (DMT)-like permease
MAPPGPSSATRVAQLQVAVAAIAWGTWSIFLRPVSIDARWSSAIALTAVTLAAAPLLFDRRHRGPQHGPPRAAAEWGWIVALGGVDALNVGCFFGAMARTTVAVAVLTHYLAPLFVAIAAPRFLGTEPRRGTTLLATIALVGLALVLEPWRARGGVDASHTWEGAFLGATSAVFYAANVLITKRIGGRFTPVEQLVYHAAISAPLLAVAAVVGGAALPSVDAVVRVAAAGAVVGAVAGLLFLRGLARIPAEQASMLTFLEPLTAVLVGWLHWHEAQSPLALLGGVVVLTAGAATVVSAEFSPSPSTSA